MTDILKAQVVYEAVRSYWKAVGNHSFEAWHNMLDYEKEAYLESLKNPTITDNQANRLKEAVLKCLIQ